MSTGQIRPNIVIPFSFPSRKSSRPILHAVFVTVHESSSWRTHVPSSSKRTDVLLDYLLALTKNGSDSIRIDQFSNESFGGYFSVVLRLTSCGTSPSCNILLVGAFIAQGLFGFKAKMCFIIQNNCCCFWRMEIVATYKSTGLSYPSKVVLCILWRFSSSHVQNLFFLLQDHVAVGFTYVKTANQSFLC